MKPKQSRADRLLRKGGQTAFQRAAAAEVYDVKGVDRERSTAAGQVTFVRQLLDPRLKLEPRQRAVAQTFGAYFEALHSGGNAEFLREFVDKTQGVSTGASEAQLHRFRMVQCGVRVLSRYRPATYPEGKSRGRVLRGRHKPIDSLRLMLRICVHGQTLSAVAIEHEWSIRKRGKDGQYGLPVVPDRQRKAVAEALRDRIDLVSDAWEDHRFEVPYSMMGVDVE